MGGVYFFKILKIIFLFSPFEKLHHSLLHLSILFLTFFSSTMLQMSLSALTKFYGFEKKTEKCTAVLSDQIFKIYYCSFVCI